MTSQRPSTTDVRHPPGLQHRWSVLLSPRAPLTLALQFWPLLSPCLFFSAWHIHVPGPLFFSPIYSMFTCFSGFQIICLRLPIPLLSSSPKCLLGSSVSSEIWCNQGENDLHSSLPLFPPNDAIIHPAEHQKGAWPSPYLTLPSAHSTSESSLEPSTSFFFHWHNPPASHSVFSLSLLIATLLTPFQSKLIFRKWEIYHILFKTSQQLPVLFRINCKILSKVYKALMMSSPSPPLDFSCTISVTSIF